MCGISGIYQLNGARVEEQRLQQMTDIIDYRGPDGFGYWYNSDQTLGLGHRRLSIIDLSNAGHQPMTYMGLTITFNGEIYNYLELKKELVAKGYQFKTESDTEVLLAAYHAKGKDCLKEIDGMFSFAIWNESKKELFCARDRFGEKPFHYYYDSNRFMFGSEIKQLIAAGVPKEPNAAMLYKFCTTNALTDPFDIKQTFYKNILQLPHSHSLLIKADKSLQIEKYWEVDYRRQDSTLSFDAAAERFNELLAESVNRRLRADVPTGTSLSGGLDSTTIASYICRSQPATNLNTFTASFKGFEKDETKFVAILKERYKNINDFYVSPTADDLAADLEKLLYHQDEPLDSTSMYAQYRVMKLAKENNVTVLLDGQGSDEFMSGYNQYWPVVLRELFIKRDRSYAEEKQRVKELTGFEQNISGNLAFMLRYPRLHRQIGSLKRSVSSPKTKLPDNPLSADFFTPQNSTENTLVDWSNLNSVLNNSMFQAGLQNLLRYADRNSMAHSREVRLPFLYYKLVEFVFSLPSHYKMSNGWSKHLLRKAQDPYLPAEICWRKEKVGYATPQSYWMQNEKMKEYQVSKKEQLQKTDLFDQSFLNSADEWKIINLAHLLK